ncbi:MAG: glycosyltransferase, partial [Desulfobacteraceae bacterium]|jgi:glycosyltransferase involved in cell wall biosynthesis
MSRNILRGPKNRIRLVHTFHGHVFHSYFGSLKSFAFVQIERFLARFTDKIIVVSPLQQKDICWKYRIARPEKVRIIPLGFDLSDFKDTEKYREGIREKYFPDASKDILLIGIVGRLTHVKNHLLLLEAAKRLKDWGKDYLFRFLVVGDGELRKTLMDYASELGLEKSVVFTGWQKEMPFIYGALDVVALTSLNEGTPVTLIEAMAAGKPVIATDVGGVRDLLGPIDKKSSDAYELAQNGILVPSGEGEILAKALVFFSENRALSKRMAKCGQAFVLKHYSTERMVKDHESLYTELVNGDKP